MKPLNAITALAISATVLFAVWGWLSATPIDISPIMPTDLRPDVSTTAATDAQSTGPRRQIDDLNAIVTHPLFSPDRRIFVPPPVEPPKPAAVGNALAAKEALPERLVAQTVAAELHLLGVSIGNGRSRVLLAEGDQDPSWISLGALISDWTVREIDAGGAIVEGHGTQIRLELYQQNKRE